jgi:hypothetical protein
VDVKYVTYPPDFGGFNDAAKAKEIALAQYEEGADIIYHAAGGAGNGLFEAAKEVSPRCLIIGRKQFILTTLQFLLYFCNNFLYCSFYNCSSCPLVASPVKVIG